VLSVFLALAVAVQPTQLRATAGATATVTVSAPAGARLIWWCSAGELSAPVAGGEGKQTAVYHAPETRLPMRVLIAVWDEASGEAARTSLAVAARVTVPVETDAGALVTLQLHGRRATAHANAAGVARPTTWVWPDEHVATVIARDVAGNASTTEVALDVPRAASLFVMAPDELAAGATARVFAFAVGEGAPALSVGGGTLEAMASRAGMTTAMLRGPDTAAAGDMTLTASLDGATATRHVRLLAPPAATTTERPLSNWELGASLSGRYAGALSSIALAVELRRLLAPRRFAIGLDVDARYAAGTVDMAGIALGGAALRLTGEARFRLTPSTFAVVAVAIGGTLVRERRAMPPGADLTPVDGGPSLGASFVVLKRLGPGWLTVAAGFSWAPLVGLSLVNSDGGTLTLGYRAARWPRRRRRGHRRAGHGGGTPRAHRRRPAPAA
jgi:hypothetical protein